MGSWWGGIRRAEAPFRASPVAAKFSHPQRFAQLALSQRLWSGSVTVIVIKTPLGGGDEWCLVGEPQGGEQRLLRPALQNYWHKKAAGNPVSITWGGLGPAMGSHKWVLPTGWAPAAAASPVVLGGPSSSPPASSAPEGRARAAPHQLRLLPTKGPHHRPPLGCARLQVHQGSKRHSAKELKCLLKNY